jgi:Winged helix DNA-binding domain
MRQLLTRRRLNRATLARQLLLERARSDAEQGIAAVAGLQGQRPDDPYIGLWSRLDGFRCADLVQAQEERRVVKATLMRGTLHLVAAADYPLVATALRPMLQRLWQRYLSDRPDVPMIEEITGRALQYATEPRSPDELRRFLDDLGVVTDLNVADLWWRVRTHGTFLHAPPSGTWRYRGRPSFVAAAPGWTWR